MGTHEDLSEVWARDGSKRRRHTGVAPRCPDRDPAPCVEPGSRHDQSDSKQASPTGRPLWLLALGTGIGDLVSRLSSVSPTLVVLDSSGGESLDDCELGGTLILAVGSEAGGPSRELLEAASLRLTIPLAAPVESLNAAVAAGVVLYEIARRRRSRERGSDRPC